MAPEIADSDEELEIEVHLPNATTAAPATTRLVDIGNYDPTQALSDLNSSTNKGTNSTDRLLNGLQEAVSDGAGEVAGFLPNPTEMEGAAASAVDNRRSQSELLDPHHEHDSSRKKRAKTYGSRNHEISSSIFADLSRNDEQKQSHSPQEFSYHHQEIATPNVPGQTETGVQEQTSYTRERDRPRRVISLLGQANNGNPLTTTMSSVGSYRSINLDFRDGSNGVDVNVNPFGSISQMTNDVDLPMEQALPSQSNTDQLHDLIDEFAAPDIQSQMQTSPIRQITPTAPSVEPLSESDQPARSDQAPPIIPEESERPAKRRKTDLALPRQASSPELSRALRASSMSPSMAVPATMKPSAKKRGRKSKVSKLELDADELGADDPAHVVMGPPPAGDSREPRQGREASLDLSSQTSQLSQAASNTKRKRKKTKTEELKKLPSSELHLSDEQIIGLPKENYQPRPSRSRSKRTDNGPLPIDGGSPLKAIEVDQASPLPPSSTGKGRKSKVKRAKTAAGALLKKAEPMLSDGEEDVLWVDTKPAPVKLDLPPDLKALKKEDAAEPDASEDELQEPGSRKRAVLSVEIPILESAGLGQDDGSAEKNAPKKRGRKPKKGAAVRVQDPVMTALETGEQDDRVPLAAKHVNTPAKVSARSKAVITDSDDEGEQPPPVPAPVPADKENELIIEAKPTTPSPSKASARPTHSPLRATPLSSSSSASTSRYRIGLSRKTRIPSLLRKVQRDKPPPTKTAIKSKELKVKGFNDGGDMEGGEDGEGGKAWDGVLRDKDGRLVEWDF
jgi:hypothetical protein